MGKLTISMAIFNSYVKLPEGKYGKSSNVSPGSVYFGCLVRSTQIVILATWVVPELNSPVAYEGGVAIISNYQIFILKHGDQAQDRDAQNRIPLHNKRILMGLACPQFRRILMLETLPTGLSSLKKKWRSEGSPKHGLPLNKHPGVLNIIFSNGVYPPKSELQVL